MKLLVTGGAGYIGSVFVESALDAGHAVHVLDDLSEGHRAAVDPRASFVRCDLASREATFSALGEARAEAVVHFAGSALVGESMRDPSRYFRNNVAAGINLLDAVVASRVRKLVFSSTCATYGVPERLPIDEASPQRPVNPYGESKLLFEKMLRWYGQVHGLEHVAFRYFNAAGASERFGEAHRVETHLIPNVLKVALGQAPHVEIYGGDHPTPDGTCLRDYIHVGDLALAHLLALAPGAQGCFNLGTGSGASVREVLRACERVVGRSLPVQERERRPGDPPRLVAAAQRAAAELGWKPQVPRLDDIVASAWAWHRAHPHGYSDGA